MDSNDRKDFLHEFDILDETYGLDGEIRQNSCFFALSSSTGTSPFYQKPLLVAKSIFLPLGFPDSVRSEYLEYQFWDAVQGLCSYLRSIITTKAVLTGVGVGNSAVTPLAAALTWVTKDGAGMIGSLTLAYYCTGSFEAYTKEWRLLADVLNNIGLTFDLLCSIFPNFTQLFLVLSSISKSSCGLIAGATKARISSHFAREGCLADVNAKESTQETAVALLGMMLGFLLTKMVGDNDYSIWSWFMVFLLLHMYSNYRLTKILVFDTLNPQRIFLITQLSQGENLNQSFAKIISSPLQISSFESLLLPVYLWYSAPIIGSSVQDLRCEDSFSFWELSRFWEKESFLIGIHKSSRICICLREKVAESEIIKAYFIATYIDSTSPNKKTSMIHFLDLCKEAICWYEKIERILADSPWNIKSSSSLIIHTKRFRFELGSKKND